ncbi:cytoskeleton-associated protein 2 [Perognathus longimembris pacificus]|uniref:cytoskeleton-associated protein 2 n=1 Tax=Perognathus longimembris pacificus TaxID=214514 RepID=UPI002019A0BB|nr:cytoskeleton-associated protein 2 [Perognathus longimembris pacificus]
MTTPTVPQHLQLPATQRAQSAFREQRRQKLAEHLLRRKTMFSYKQENKISSSGGQRVMIPEDHIQEETKVLKLKAKMDDKENIKRIMEDKHNPVENHFVTLKPKELTNSTTTIETHNFEDNQKLLPIKDNPLSQTMTLSQAFHFKNSNKHKQVTVDKPKQDANMPKKPVLGCYRGQIVQSKINSFRKPLQVKDETSATTKKLSSTFSKATKPELVNTSSVTVRSDKVSNKTTTTQSLSTKSVSSTSQHTQLVRPSIRSLQSSTHDIVKQGTSRTSASVTIRKGPPKKESLQSKPVLSSVKTGSPQDIKRCKALSRNTASENVARPAPSFNTKLIEKSKTIDHRRHTIIAKATVDKSAPPKETAEERKARLSEWRANKGRVLKRPPNSITQLEPEGQKEKPVASFWTTMAEEDEQRLFTEKVNKTFSECLSLINKGYPKEEIMSTLNDLIKNIPDAKTLVKYWICLIRIEPVTSPIENIISIYEKAILAGAQPIEEMRHEIVDILTMKSQEKANLGENTKETGVPSEQIQEIYIEDKVVDLEPENSEGKNNRDVLCKDYEKEQDHKTKDTTDDVAAPETETGASCLIKYNISTTPYLQSIKKKMQLDETNSAFKDLKFLTPVRRSRRLQEKTSKLPDMLKDHYPCVSSLEQLSELGGETDAFVCRPNTALFPMFSETDGTTDELKLP